MKSERRHELQENELILFLYQQWKPIFGVFIAIVVGILAGVLLNIERTADKNMGWNSLFSALEDDNAVELEEVAKANENRAAGHWATFLAGIKHLENGTGQAFTSPEEGAIDLSNAINAFDTVIDATDDRYLKCRALWAKAQALETKATEKDLQAAQATYALIPEAWPNSGVAKAAQKRVEVLNDPQVVGKDGFYAWYREQDFSALAEASSVPGAFDSTLPGLPDFSLPSSDSLSRPDASNKPAAGRFQLPELDIDSSSEKTESEPATTTPSVFSDKERPQKTEAEEAIKPAASQKLDTDTEEAVPQETVEEKNAE